MPTLNWIGKDAVIRHHREVPFRLLEPVPALAATLVTGQALSPLLGIHDGRAIFLLYNGILKDQSMAGGNILTGPLLDRLPKSPGPKVVYATANQIGNRTGRENITCKQTPYALDV